MLAVGALKIWLPFEGNAVDALGVHTQTVSGSPSYSLLLNSYGITLDTSSKKITTPDASSLKAQSFSISFTFKRSAAGSWETDICKGTASMTDVCTAGWSIAMNNALVQHTDEMKLYIKLSGGRYAVSTGASSIANNTEYKICFTYNDSSKELKAYLDGLLKNTTTGSGTFTPSTELLRFNPVFAGYGSCTATFDNFNYYQGVLSQSDIVRIYQGLHPISI